MKLYAVEGSAYDGCNGWESWIMQDSITPDLEEAQEFQKKHSGSGGDFRSKIIVYRDLD